VPLGLNGGSYAGVCPPAIDGVFQQRFQTARAVYDLRSEVKGLDDRIESLERRLRGIHQEEEKRQKEATSEEERKKIRKALDDERRDIRADLGEADRRLRRKRDELRSAEFTLSTLR
jgi:predicted  nucleic acid-binding Zn-ribbon protein